MNNYITLDGKRYHAIHDQWTPTVDRPMMKRRLLSGVVNVKFGAAIFRSWRGTIHVPVTAESTDFGNLADFRATYAKMTSLAYSDHYGTAYTVVLDRTIDERSLAPDWAATENIFKFPISLVKIT